MDTNCLNIDITTAWVVDNKITNVFICRWVIGKVTETSQHKHYLNITPSSLKRIQRMQLNEENTSRSM